MIFRAFGSGLLAGALACAMWLPPLAPGAAIAQQPDFLSLRISSEFKSTDNVCPTPSSSEVIDLDLGNPGVVHRASTGWLDFSVSLGGTEQRSVVVSFITDVSPSHEIVIPVDVLYERKETTIYTNLRLPDYTSCRGLILYFARV